MREFCKCDSCAFETQGYIYREDPLKEIYLRACVRASPHRIPVVNINIPILIA